MNYKAKPLNNFFLAGLFTVLSLSPLVACQKPASQHRNQVQQPKPTLADRMLPVWANKNGDGYCILKHPEVKKAIDEFHADGGARIEHPVHSLERAEGLIAQGRPQEAIWEFEKINHLERSRQHRTDLHEALTHGTYSVENSTYGGTSPKKVLKYTNGISALFKYIELDPTGVNLLFWNNPQAEVAAYELDKLLGTHLVPATIIQQVGQIQGSLMYILNDVTEPGLDIVKARNFSAIKVFDYLSGNQDRKPENMLYSPKENHVYAIDNGCSFKVDYNYGHPEQIAEFLKTDQTLLNRIRNLEDQEVQDALTGFLTAEEIQALQNRLHRLQAAIQ